MTDGTMYPPSLYRKVGKDIVERWIEGQPERDANRALCNSHFDKARDAANAKRWAEQGDL